MPLQIDQENEAEEAASRLPSTKGDIVRNGDARDSQGGESADSTHAPHATRESDGEGERVYASGLNGQAAGSGALNGETHLKRSSSRSRRSLYRESFGVHSPEYAADCGSIEEPDPSSPRGIERVSAARLDSHKSGSLGRSASLSRDRSASLSRDRSLSGSFKRIVGRS